MAGGRLRGLATRFWPAPLHRFTGWLLLLPALLLVGLLVAGLIYIADFSLRELDPDTYRLAKSYSLANYAEVGRRTVYLWIMARSLLAALIVTLVVLVLGFPYAYAMVRTGSPWLRKLLLIGLFLPFFIGQGVRAYGWLIVLGNQGLINQLLGVRPRPLQIALPLPGRAARPHPVHAAVCGFAAGAGDRRDRRGGRARLGESRRQLAAGLLACRPADGQARPGRRRPRGVHDYALPDILGGGTNDFVPNAIYDAFFQISDAGLGSALAVILVFSARPSQPRCSPCSAPAP